MKKLLTALFFLVLCHGLAEAGQEIVAVQSIRVNPYEEAMKGFRSVCHSKLQRIVISELQGKDLSREIKMSRPDMLVAIGRDALYEIRRIRNIPIVYLMVLNPRSVLSGEKNITGVSMNIPPDRQLMALMDILPHTKDIGLLYDPDRTGPFVAEARYAARRAGITLMAREIHNSRDAPSFIMDMRERIDVFWMLPDITVMTPETLEFLLLFSIKHRIPLLAFSEKYLELGAFISTGIDAFDIGAQAGEMANKILSGREVKHVRHAHARKLVVSTNLMIAGKLEIPLNFAMASDAQIDEKIVRNALTVAK